MCIYIFSLASKHANTWFRRNLIFKKIYLTCSLRLLTYDPWVTINRNMLQVANMHETLTFMTCQAILYKRLLPHETTTKSLRINAYFSMDGSCCGLHLLMTSQWTQEFNGSDQTWVQIKLLSTNTYMHDLSVSNTNTFIQIQLNTNKIHC